jgi:hypothetical protein
MPSDTQLQTATRSIVERARLGDQNALALIICVRENAGKGNALAKKSLGMITDYAKSNPPGRRPSSQSQVHGAFSSLLARLRDWAKRVTSPEDYVKTVVAQVPKLGPTIADTLQASHALANGPPIDATLLQSVQAALPTDPEKKAFAFAAQSAGTPKAIAAAASNSKDPVVKAALQLGFALGQARRVQLVRSPETPLAHYSRVVAWELGEDQAA